MNIDKTNINKLKIKIFREVKKYSRTNKNRFILLIIDLFYHTSYPHPLQLVSELMLFKGTKVVTLNKYFAYILKNRYVLMKKSTEEQILELPNLLEQVYSFTIINS